MIKRYKIEVQGIVQGVGFRPFVYNTARELDLKGWVTNTSDGVLIEVEGARDSLANFMDRLNGSPPPISKISSISHQLVPGLGYREFVIRESLANPDVKVLISPDVSICSDCRAELLDPEDRRFKYPFINCTNCGPRYTIIDSAPYDRPNTSMKTFTMCEPCLAEYEDPSDRRFHAQPNACHDCGPALSLFMPGGKEPDDDPFAKAVGLLAGGKTLAVRGLGGFHLVADPANDKAVSRLRTRKGREEKPLALMVKDIVTANELCIVDELGERYLESIESPIVLLPKRNDPSMNLTNLVAPRSRYYGLMLPYTPLHVLLMEEFPVLIMTSANLSDEPLCAGNEEAAQRLKDIADAYLVHDREIVLRCDDSIVRPDIRESEKGPLVLRRARGYVPAPVFIPVEGDPVLALGPELKGTICLTKENRAFIGQHLGDLKNLETMEFLKEVVNHLTRILEVEPVAVACDMHPDYLTTGLALEKGDKPWPEDLPVLQVQHHQAHILSCQAENGLTGPVIGLALDGTGYGPDNTVWGGELLYVDGTRMERLGHLKQVWMPGGEKAILEPYRMALSYIFETMDGDFKKLSKRLFPDIDPGNLEILLTLIRNRSHGILTSSTGRLFDAFSAMLGVCTQTRYEGQPAIELEMLTDGQVADILPFSIEGGDHADIVMDMHPAFAKALELRLSGADAGVLGGMFHRTLAAAFGEAAEKALGTFKELERRVVLSGGVMQNETLCSMITAEFENRKIQPVLHRTVPPNDGGISLGQAVYVILQSGG